MNGRSLALGQYYPVRSPLHSLDPRIKLILVIMLITAVFFIDRFWVLLASALILPVLIRMSSLPYGWVWRSVRPLGFIVLFTLAIHFLFTPGRALFALGPIVPTAEGLGRGLFYSARLVLVIVFSSFITLTTTPVQLTDAIEAMLRPLEKIRFPAHEFALMTTIALRFIPTLLTEAETIMKAQQARGARFGSGGLWRRARSFIPVLVPLFVGAFRRAEELALAMEARGYAGGEGRTRLRQLRITGTDLIWLSAGLLIISGLVAADWLI